MRGCKGWGCSPFPTLGMCLSLSFVLLTPPSQRHWWSVKAWELPKNHKTSIWNEAMWTELWTLTGSSSQKPPCHTEAVGVRGPLPPAGVLQLLRFTLIPTLNQELNTTLGTPRDAGTPALFLGPQPQGS